MLAFPNIIIVIFPNSTRLARLKSGIRNQVPAGSSSEHQQNFTCPLIEWLTCFIHQLKLPVLNTPGKGWQGSRTSTNNSLYSRGKIYVCLMYLMVCDRRRLDWTVWRRANERERERVPLDATCFGYVPFESLVPAWPGYMYVPLSYTPIIVPLIIYNWRPRLIGFDRRSIASSHVPCAHVGLWSRALGG